MTATENHYFAVTGKVLDCGRGWWTPPLVPQAAVELERSQICRMLELPAVVSLTDHDNCQAGLDTNTPVSIEWTIPLSHSFLHLGVHNLPRSRAPQLAAAMNEHTAQPVPARLRELLTELHRLPGVLVVCNHPLWDESLMGSRSHDEMVTGFLRNHAPWIHALELNGLRPGEENERVVALAAAFRLPLVSGGDRHGREPNANLNLTRASTFGEFIAEVRVDRLSHVLFMPQYREPMRLRKFDVAWDLLRRDSKRADGRCHWCDRMYFQTEEGVIRPLTWYFGQRGPGVLLPFLAVMSLLERPALRPMLRAALSD